MPAEQLEVAGTDVGIDVDGGVPGDDDPKAAISARTVETHVSSVLDKLQLWNRHDLTRWATERRLI